MDKRGQPDDADRRIFIKGVGQVTAGLFFATMFGGCESIIKQIENRPIRRRLRTGSSAVDNDVAIYKDAVAQMKALPASDPRSWVAQAAIHGTAGVSFNHCQHGNSFFFPWHRAYLFYFERICRALTGESSFGLPYWNWNQNPDVHPAFLDPSPSNSLFEGTRNRSSVSGNSAFSDATMNTIFGDSNFYTFSSQLEGQPHNNGHTYIGGILGGYGSASDPLFWAHHCMVDYSWAKWNIELGNDNTDDATWLGTTWSHFVDADGNPAESSAALTILMPLLSYQYECSAVGDYGCPLVISDLSASEFKKLQERVKKGTKVSFDIKQRIPISRGQQLMVNQPILLKSSVSTEQFASIVETDKTKERVFLQIRYADLPENNDFFIRAFINLPNADANTSTEIDNFAGSFSFFGTKSKTPSPTHSKMNKPEFLINVTDTLKTLRAKGKIRSSDEISVNLVVVPSGGRFIKSDTQLNLEGIDFIVSPVKIRAR